MLCFKFELIPIKVGFLQILKICSKIGPTVQGIWPNFAKNEKERIFFFKINFPDTYTGI